MLWWHLGALVMAGTVRTQNNDGPKLVEIFLFNAYSSGSSLFFRLPSFLIAELANVNIIAISLCK